MIASLTLGVLSAFVVLVPVGMALVVLRGVIHPGDDPSPAEAESVPATTGG
jgi:hypothetical protein